MRSMRVVPHSLSRETQRSRKASETAPAAKKSAKDQFRGAWPEARRLVWRQRHRMAVGLLLILGNRIAGLALPASTKVLVDDVITGQKVELLGWIVLLVALATVVQAACGFALSQVLGVAAQRAITDMRRAIHRHVLRLPVQFFDSQQSGALISRTMTDAEGIRNLVGSGLVQLLGGTLTAIIALVVLFQINATMTTACLAIILVFGGLLAVVFKRVRPIFRQRGQVQAEVTGRLGESFGGIRVVKAYRAEHRENRTFARGVHRLFRLIAKTITSVSSVESAAALTMGLIGALIMYMGGQAVLTGQMTVGDLVMYVFFTGLLAMPVISLASIGTQITEAIAGLDRIAEIRMLATEVDDDPDKKPISSVEGAVEFDRVSFEYEAGKPVLHDVSFVAPAGTTTALVGRSGSGKSTLIGLLMAFHNPSSGRVLVDGQDVSQVRLADYRRFLGVVLQENFLFDGTIADNIGFSRPTASRQEIEAAARTAYCHEFVDPLEEGYDTLVGERGVRLSGGQRQRLAIARAILADPRILILDEATSALDSESEHYIQQGIAKLRAGRTTFVIAHRLSTIRAADQILVLDEGKLVDKGSHDELLQRGGLYKDLWDRQQGLRKNQFLNPGEEGLPRED